MLVTEGNFLRCPECRLIYQLRRGVKSLPKNVALQRTIDERGPTAVVGRSNRGTSSLMCETHPDDAVSLYCRTCEKAICLKCYFTNTIRKGDTMHTGHQVDTSEDMFSKERVSLSISQLRISPLIFLVLSSVSQDAAEKHLRVCL